MTHYLSDLKTHVFAAHIFCPCNYCLCGLLHITEIDMLCNSGFVLVLCFTDSFTLTLTKLFFRDTQCSSVATCFTSISPGFHCLTTQESFAFTIVLNVILITIFSHFGTSSSQTDPTLTAATTGSHYCQYGLLNVA